MNMSEKTLHRAVCDYIRYQFPTVLFNSDMSGAMKLSIGQAVQIKSLRSNRGFPDLQIFEKRMGYGALFIELKKEGTKLFKKDHSPATPHIEEQLDCIRKLTCKGYKCTICVGFDEAKITIDDYLYNVL